MTLLANPLLQLKAAAYGDLDAMRAFADNAIELARLGVTQPERTLVEGLVIARMAASVGDIADKGRLIGMLGLLGIVAADERLRDDALAEALGVTVALADSGEDEAEIAATGVNAIVEIADAEALESARIYVDAYKEAM